MSEAPTLAETCDSIVVAEGPVRAWAEREECEGPAEARRLLTAIAALVRPVDASAAPAIVVGARWREP